MSIGNVRKCGWMALVLMLVTASAMAAGTGNGENPKLENLVLQDCGSCHGMTLRGGLGPPLRPENLRLRPVQAIAAIIREGIPGTAMPPWKPLLTEEEIQWISHSLKAGALVSP